MTSSHDIHLERQDITFAKDMGNREAADQFRYESFYEHVRRSDSTSAEGNDGKVYG